MRSRLLAFFVLVALLPFLTGATIVIRGPLVPAAAGGPTLVASVQKHSTDSQAITTDAIDTTGASLLVMWAAYGVVIDSVSDSKSNTWTPLTQVMVGSAYGRMYYAANPTVGSGHTFTVSGIAKYPSVQVIALSGMATTTPFDQENTNTNTSWTTIQPGSITPSQANTVAVVGLTFEQPTSGISIGDGYTIAQTSQGVSGNSYGGSIAYKVLSSATAQNPTWTSTVSNGNGSSGIASFKY